MSAVQALTLSGCHECVVASSVLYLLCFAAVGECAHLSAFKLSSFGHTLRYLVCAIGHAEPRSRPLVIHFNADVSDRMPWKFRPIQKEVTCVPGEPVLAFFNATNTSDEPLIGISTYNVTPPKAGVYFNKIQCFCFEEQQLQPHESVDMPVFFFIDPEFCADDNLHGVDELTLSYTFFKVDQADSVR